MVQNSVPVARMGSATTSQQFIRQVDASLGVSAFALAVIDFGNGASVLAFANSSTQAWTGTLTILNWTGTPFAGGGTDQLFFGTDSSGLTNTQLSQIAFYSDGGDTFLGVSGYVADGEVAPVPEPSTWLAGAVVFAAVKFSQRRRMRKHLGN